MPRLVDSTRFTTTFKCAQSRHWLTEYLGRGITAITEREPTNVGTALHVGIQALLLGCTLEEAYDRFLANLGGTFHQTLDDESSELEWRWHGWGVLEQFQRTVLRHMQAQFDIYAIEQELVLKLTPDLWWLTRPDVMVSFKVDDARYQINIKSTHYSEDILRNYEYSAQVPMEARAASEHWGVPVKSLLLVVDKAKRQGPLKQDGDKKGQRLNSPYCYVWWDPSDKTYGWTYGSKRVKLPAWRIFKHPSEMLTKIPENNWSQWTYLVGPLPSQHADGLEQEILEVENLVASGWKARNRDACNNYGGYGSPCQYKPICWEGPQMIDQYEPRHFNHPLEETLYNENHRASRADRGGPSQQIWFASVQL